MKMVGSTTPKRLTRPSHYLALLPTHPPPRYPLACHHRPPAHNHPPALRLAFALQAALQGLHPPPLPPPPLQRLHPLLTNLQGHRYKRQTVGSDDTVPGCLF